MPASLVLASLDIGRVLADRDGVTFRTQGTCMYPTVRPGDVMRIRSCPAAQVQVGEIAVCRGPDFLFSHRVIATGNRDGQAYIVTRPDRSHHGSDGPTFDEDLLGVVVTLTRNGRPVPLTPTLYPWPLRSCYAVRLAWIEAAPRWRIALANLLTRLQDNRLWRGLQRAGFALMRPRISYQVRLPHARLGDAAYQRLTPAEFDPQAVRQGRRVERWTLTLHVNDGCQPAAWLTMARVADGGWRVVASSVRARYRGVGVSAMLIDQAQSLLGQDLLFD